MRAPQHLPLPLDNYAKTAVHHAIRRLMHRWSEMEPRDPPEHKDTAAQLSCSYAKRELDKMTESQRNAYFAESFRIANSGNESVATFDRLLSQERIRMEAAMSASWKVRSRELSSGALSLDDSEID